MEFIDVLKSRVKTKEKKKIVLPESEDVRVLKAASMVRKEDLADIILIGKKRRLLLLLCKMELICWIVLLWIRKVVL